MNIKVMPNLFLVRINKKEQKDFKEKLSKNSPFFTAVSSQHNARNMECGEIVQIGERIKIYGWENCKVGMQLIFHHSIESPVSSKGKDKYSLQYFIYEDEGFNYYVVDDINCRGFFDGEKITPHPNFVFLKNLPAYDNNDEIDQATGNKIKQSSGGIFMVTNWDDSPQNIAQKSQKIKDRIESLTKSKRTPERQLEMERLEQERIKLNRKSQKHEFLPFKVAFSNRKLDRDFSRKIQEDDILYCYNKACLYISNFQDKDYSYIICLTEHIGCLKIEV